MDNILVNEINDKLIKVFTVFNKVGFTPKKWTPGVKHLGV